jgi:hypothetical protein
MSKPIDYPENMALVRYMEELIQYRENTSNLPDVGEVNSNVYLVSGFEPHLAINSFDCSKVRRLNRREWGLLQAKEYYLNY